jgi:FlaA1/EpsC-like NDP-sugar epimerase
MLAFRSLLNSAVNANRYLKRGILVIFDSCAIMLAVIAAMALRLESLSFLTNPDIFLSISIILIPTLAAFALTGLYRAFLRHISIEVVATVGFGSAVAAATLYGVKFLFGFAIPLSVPVLAAVLLFLLVAGVRFTLRAAVRSLQLWNDRRRVAIYGAGDAAVQTIRALQYSPDYEICLVIDDDPSLHKQLIFGLKVMDFDAARGALAALSIDMVILAMPSASFSARQATIERLTALSLDVKTLPSLSSLLDGTAQFTELRDIEIEDLLGREPVVPDANLMRKNITGKTVLVSGAGGSIGSELCRQILKWAPSRLILLDVSEYAIYTVSQEFEASADKKDCDLVCLVGSVTDRPFLKKALRRYAIDTIYHAAAYKHVPLMEQNAHQAVINNAFGTLAMAQEAIDAKVGTFILISTDKAVNPTNVMGASKRLAELICQTKSRLQTGTCFSMVRFGNVLGSSGSVVPLFKQQIKNGGPITITHPDITRYFMTIPEAAQLVIQAGAMATGGEVFVLDMSKPIRILDFAFKIVQLSGLKPYLEGAPDSGDGDIAIRTVGLRPGEKLFEELSHKGNLANTEHPRIFMVQEVALDAPVLQRMLADIENAISADDHDALALYLASITNYNRQDPAPANGRPPISASNKT